MLLALISVAIFDTFLFSSPSHRIQVRQVNGRGELYDAQTGRAFVPRGSNYIQLSSLQTFDGTTITYHSTFNVGLYDSTKTETDLARMQADGYNMVRVFVQGATVGSIPDPNGGLNSSYVANVVDFLNRAKAHGIYVLITIDDPPKTAEYNNLFFAQCCAQFAGTQLNFLTAGGLSANQKFWTDFINALILQSAPLDAILAYELRNELSFDSSQLPFTMSSGTVATANGKTYDMAVTASRQAMMDDNLVYFVDQNRTTIRLLDPTALVTVGFFQSQQPHPCRYGDPRIIQPYPAIANSSADFVDLHPYPNVELTMSEYADNFGMNGYNKQPVIMGEFGAFMNRYSSASDAAFGLQQWQYQSCAFNYAGWMVWTWDTGIQPDGALWNMIADSGRIEGVISPKFRTNPCSPLGFSTAKLDFGGWLIGSYSAPQTITITNLAAIAIPFGTISVTGGHQLDDQCPATLAAGASCNVNVRFRPTKAGSNAAALSVVDPTTTATFAVALSGTGMETSVTPTRPSRPSRMSTASSSATPAPITNARPQRTGRSIAQPSQKASYAPSRPKNKMMASMPR